MCDLTDLVLQRSTNMALVTGFYLFIFSHSFADNIEPNYLEFLILYFSKNLVLLEEFVIFNFVNVQKLS